MVTIGSLFADTIYADKFVLQKFLCTFLHCSREELWTNMDKEISDEIVQKILVAYKSYVEDKKPLEYILGHVDFFGREFFVNEATLIPRPETEYMITAVTDFIQEMQDVRSKIQVSDSNHASSIMHQASNVLLDIGTGCGVLGISVLLQNPGYFPEAIFTDYYANALEIAKKNYELLMTNYQGKVSFLQSDLLERWNDKSSTLKGTPSFEIKEVLDKNVILVANLPYIPEKMFEDNVADNVKKREPKPAFVGGDDGLDYYRIMLDQILELRHKYQDIRLVDKNLTTGYLIPITMFLEMMTWQVEVLEQEFGQYFVFEEVKTFHFNIRIVKAWLK